MFILVVLFVFLNFLFLFVTLSVKLTDELLLMPKFLAKYIEKKMI